MNSDILKFYLKFESEGLGDRFVLVSTILNIINEFERDAIVYFIKNSTSGANIPAMLGISLTNAYLSSFHRPFYDFYEIVDFFHFKRPKNKIFTNFCKDQEFSKNMYHGGGYTIGEMTTPSLNDFLQASNKVWEEGSYWPIDFPIREKRKNVCYMLYELADINLVGSRSLKGITKDQVRKFKTLTETFPEITFINLEHRNYLKNVEILSESHFIFATEGMWTHLSRAMNIHTVAHVVHTEPHGKEIQINKQMNNQGHYSSFSFDECLEKMKNLCEKI